MDKKNNKQEDGQNDLDKPDPETLHTTDPQEHMEGPVSSVMQGVKKTAEKNTDLSEAPNNDEDEDEDENHYDDSVGKS